VLETSLTVKLLGTVGSLVSLAANDEGAIRVTSRHAIRVRRAVTPAVTIARRRPAGKHKGRNWREYMVGPLSRWFD
jgi:hypothetical protein